MRYDELKGEEVEEEVVAYFKLWFGNLSRFNKENHEHRQSR
jgi:hypothetical protein